MGYTEASPSDWTERDQLLGLDVVKQALWSQEYKRLHLHKCVYYYERGGGNALQIMRVT